MTSVTSLHSARFNSSGDEILSDYRQRKAIEENERAERRRADSAEQYSALNSADRRIRAWEKIHQLRMPSDASHPVVAAIVRATQLTMEEVLNEQRLRSARRASVGV